MPETITLHALDLSGETTLKLFLRKDDGTLLNTGGDALTEISSSGVFTATLGESRAGFGDLSYRVCDGTETADNLLIDGFLPETETTIGASGTAVLDSTTSTKINDILEDTGTTLPGLIDAIEGGGGGAGTGARTVTITVNDGSTVLQNATVRMTEGVNTYTASTNVSGVAVFNLDDATYTVGISKSGYSYAGTTIVVNGTETATYSMTAISVTPGTGSLTTGYLTCLDEEGVAEEGVSVRCQVVQIPASGTGFAYDSTVQLATSDGDGLVEFPMIKGARYLVWRGSVKPPAGIVPVLISASAGTTTALGSLIGD